MSTSHETSDGTTDVSPRPDLSWRRLSAAVLVVLLASALLGARWWTAPDLFPDSGAGMKVDPRPVATAAVTVGVTAPRTDGRRETTGLVFTDTGTVELSVDTARAEAEIAVCRAKPGADPIGLVGADEVGQFCDAVDPVADGVRMSVSQWDAPERDYVIVTLTPTRPGQVHLTEVSLRYRTDRSHSYRRGSDSVRLDVTVPVR